MTVEIRVPAGQAGRMRQSIRASAERRGGTASEKNLLVISAELQQLGFDDILNAQLTAQGLDSRQELLACTEKHALDCLLGDYEKLRQVIRLLAAKGLHLAGGCPDPKDAIEQLEDLRVDQYRGLKLAGFNRISRLVKHSDLMEVRKLIIDAEEVEKALARRELHLVTIRPDRTLGDLQLWASIGKSLTEYGVPANLPLKKLSDRLLRQMLASAPPREADDYIRQIRNTLLIFEWELPIS